MALPTPAVDLCTQEGSGIKIKTEKVDGGDVLKEKNPTEISTFIVNDPQLSGLQSRNITITVANQHTEKTVPKPSVQITSKAVVVEDKTPAKPDPPPIDHPSICGIFGWTTIGPVHIPVLLRGEERFIAVRMFECKIVFSYFPDIFPTAIFSCTNINSYYITENEAKLLNEINSFHCDYQFGYTDFSVKDYVVRLKDALNLFEFLEFCRAKLYNQTSNSSVLDKCGFLFNYKIPYVKKGSKKYISLNMVYEEGVTPPVANTETITNWDLAYFRFLSCFANVDLQKIEINKPLCNVEDLENALGGVQFEEVPNWPDIRLSSKEEWEGYLHPRTLQWIPNAVSESNTENLDDTKKLRKKLSEMQEKESMLNSLMGFNKFFDMNQALPRAAHVRNHDPSDGLNLIQNNDKGNMFPVSLENFLSTTSSCNYPYPVNYNHYNSHIQTPSLLEYERYRKSNGNMSSFSSRKPRTFPPPPPLVRLGNSRVTTVPPEQEMVPKTNPMYPYLPAPSSASCPPWYARILEPNWLQEEDNRSVIQPDEGPENLSRRLSESDSWSSTSLSSNINLNGAGSSNLVRSNSNPLGVIRENYDLSTHGSLCRDDRLLHPHGGSPRLLAGPGPPPHYPTPPQSSPLQPMSLLDCTTVPGFTDIYATRLTPSGLVDLCSPPPSPELRTALSSSPRSSHLSNYGYQPHLARLAQVDSRYVLAINVEPLKYHTNLAVPISDVVNKFLSGATVQSCQIMLESMFGLPLHECTSLQQEAFAKHNLTILPGSKLVGLNDLKNCIYQLKFVLMEREKQNEKQCDIGSSEIPLSKRWCGNAREC